MSRPIDFFDSKGFGAAFTGIMTFGITYLYASHGWARVVVPALIMGAYWIMFQLASLRFPRPPRAQVEPDSKVVRFKPVFPRLFPKKPDGDGSGIGAVVWENLQPSKPRRLELPKASRGWEASVPGGRRELSLAKGRPPSRGFVRPFPAKSRRGEK